LAKKLLSWDQSLNTVFTNLTYHLCVIGLECYWKIEMNKLFIISE